jgi:lipopolysaccharide transport system ATP-binding protein
MYENKVISLENVGKSYLIGHENKEKYTALRDIITNQVSDLITKTKGVFKGNQLIYGNEIEEFWALKNLNFSVNHGDRLGIIGKNGAGKSTLLKVLSRITDPTTGTIKIKGKISSLLEVGTGFHPELTGRENIFLNGAILGMSRKDVKTKFDEIVDFAGVEKFLDTPVKRYSSGMYVRLAFGVAAHLNCEILIVDEVLAVGDDTFQKKCLSKMNSLGKDDGKTVLFVSHNMGAIRNLCSEGILLEDGMIKTIGNIESVLASYNASSILKTMFKSFLIKKINLEVIDIKLNDDMPIIPFNPLKISIKMKAHEKIDYIGIQLMISNDNSPGILFMTNTVTTNSMNGNFNKGDINAFCNIDSLNLASGKYYLGFAIDIPFSEDIFYERHLINFEIEQRTIQPSKLPTSSVYSSFYLNHNWILS